MGHGVTTIPSNFFAVPDSAGANDVPGQVDLTQMGRDDTAATTYKLFWSWDSTDQWTGTGQTGDACALFDTDGDGNINFVACVRVENPDADPEVVEIRPTDSGQPVFLFACSDKKNDRCTNPDPVAYTTGQAAAGGLTGNPLDPNANLITHTDPFPLVGTNTPHDSTVEVHLLKSIIPGADGSEVLVNVCSYPSAGNGGNNNPFDCIVTPGTGFLVIAKNAGSDTTTNFNFAISPAPVPPASANQTITGTGQTGALVAVIGTNYSITETVPSGWTFTSASCTIQGGGSTGTNANPSTGITVASGKITTCTFTNTPVQPNLSLRKVVTNNNGGDNLASEWTLTATPTSGSAISGTGTQHATLNEATYGPNTAQASVQYTLSESGPSGYSSSGTWTCTGTGGNMGGTTNKVTLSFGANVTCTITNDDVAPTITLIKSVDNGNGGNAQPDDFALTLGGTGVLSGAATTVQANTPYAINETLVDGYTFVSITGDPECPAALGGTVTADEGESIICTITNDDVAPTITLIKDVDNDNGGDAQPNDFALTLGGAGVLSGAATTVQANTPYAINETLVDGYTFVSITGDPECPASLGGTVTADEGEDITCTITNDDVAPTITLIKSVDNGNGGTAQPNDFALTLGGTGVLSGAATEVEANTPYAINETLVSGYAFVSITGDPECPAALGGTVTAGEGESITCTINNDDIQPLLTVTKVVDNDFGGQAVVADFPLFVDATSVVSGVQNGFNAGTYIVSETEEGDGSAVYTAVISGDCDPVTGSVTLSVGDVKSCTITNSDSPASPSVTTVQSWVLHDAATIAGIRHGAPDESDATVTFRLWTECDPDTGVGTDQAGTDEIIDLLLSDSAATVDGVLVEDSGLYYWTAQYSGDAWNLGFTTECDEEVTEILAKDAKDEGRDDFISGFQAF
jgi:hypothetical protein